jgi:uncharacterized membrane protein YfcA
MPYLVSFHWGYLVGALLLGLGMGWIAVVRRGRDVPRKAMPWAGLFVAILLGLAATRVVPGRAGYWLDLGLVIFAIYLFGCAIGSWLRERVVFGRSAL